MLTASPALLCPGECTQLSVDLANPDDYVFTWDPATLPATPGPHELCPAATIRVTLSVRPKRAGLEFAGAPQRSSATIEVSDACDLPSAGRDGARDGAMSDAAVPPPSGERDPSDEGSDPDDRRDAGEDVSEDAGGMAGTQVPVGQPTCTSIKPASEVLQLNDVAGDDRQESSRRGATYVVGTFRGTLAAAANVPAIDSTGTVMDGFLMRLDGCTVLWVRSLSGTDRTIPYQVAVDDVGDVVVGGSFDNYADFGAGPMVAALSRDLFLAKFSGADGHLLWNRQYQTQETPGYNQGFTSMAIDGRGDIVVTGFSNHNTDFGEGPIAPQSPSGEVAYVAKLDAAGNLRFVHVLPVVGLTAAAWPDGKVTVAGSVAGPFLWGQDERGDPYAQYDLVGHFTADGAFGSFSLQASSAEGRNLGDGSDSLVVSPSGALHRARAFKVDDGVYGYSVVTWPTRDGPPTDGPITLQYSVRDDTETYPAQHRLSIDPAGRLYAAGTHDGIQPIGGQPFPADESHPLVIGLSDSDTIDWVGFFGTKDNSEVHLHAGASGRVCAFAQTTVPGLHVACFQPER